MTDDRNDRNDVPNVALVVLDTLRADTFREHFDWMPGEMVEHAWSTSHWTVPAHASLFTGQYAGELGVHSLNPRLHDEVPTLAERLRDSGYETTGFSCNPHLSPEFGFTRGFKDLRRNWVGRRLDSDIFPWGEFVSNKRFDGPLRYPEALYRLFTSEHSVRKSLVDGLRRKLNHTSLNLPDRYQDHGARDVLSDVRNRDWDDDRPTFYFANLMEAHIPYNPPVEYRTDGIDNGGYSFAKLIERENFDPETTRQAYDDCARYLSDVYREIFSELRSEFDYVITVSDHGEHLGEDGMWGHNFGVAPPLTNIPLHVAGEQDLAIGDAPVSLLDVHATILDLASCDSDTRGTSLFDPRESDAAERRLVEYHGICNEPTYQRLRNAGVAEETIKTYDSRYCGVVLPDGYYGYETPGEFKQRGTTNRDAEAELAVLKEDAPVTPIENKAGYSDEMTAQLEALGYV
jgi:arylsulfatase